MANRISKRHVIKCIKCGEDQSTYSTNRSQCHKCLPKCTERHTFENLEVRKKVEEENK
jgi:hypothetical protein